jgi:DNA polymerase-1
LLGNVQLTLVDTTAELFELMSWLGERRPILGFDLETTGLALGKDTPRLAQFGDGERGWALPYQDWRGAVKEILETYDRPMVGHHLKFDAGMVLQDGIQFDWKNKHDTMPMCFLADSLGPKSLKDAAALYVDERAKTTQNELVRMMTENRWTWATVPIGVPQYWAYGAMDTVLTASLAETLWPAIQQFREAYDIELACERVLTDMELRGAMIDVDYCRDKYEELGYEVEALVGQLGFNPNAPEQVATALLDEGAKLTKKTENGNISVTDDILKSLQGRSEIAEKVIEARYAKKMRGTYFENFISMNTDGVLHPHINQLAARTGRMSVTNPALQTVPRGTLVRDAFTARPGNKLILIDYDNEELRVAAHVSGDQTMLAAFDEGRDLHSETARRLYGDSFTKEQRSVAKSCMFAKAYGAGVRKFAMSSGIPPAEAEQVFRTLATLYPGMERGLQACSKAVTDRDDGSGYGYIVLGDGRHLKVKSDKSYVGFNARIQGECAVVLKKALVDLDAAGLGDFLVLPIHDEVMFDVPAALVPDVQAAAIKTMTRADYQTPLTCGATVVTRWGDKYREAA